MSEALNRLESIRNRLFGRDHEDVISNDEDKAWQIVVIDLAGSTYRLLKELENNTFGGLMLPDVIRTTRNSARLPIPGFTIFDLIDGDHTSPA